MRQFLAILIISLIIIGCGKSIIGGDCKEPVVDDGPVIQRACDHCHGWDYERQEIPPPKEENRK